MQILIQWVWAEAQDSAFLSNSQEIVMLPQNNTLRSKGLDYRVVLLKSDSGELFPAHHNEDISIQFQSMDISRLVTRVKSPLFSTGSLFFLVAWEPSKSDKGACILATSLLLDAATPNVMYILNCP